MVEVKMMGCSLAVSLVQLLDKATARRTDYLSVASWVEQKLKERTMDCLLAVRSAE